MNFQARATQDEVVAASRTRLTARVGSLFGSPFALAISVVVLVCSVGLLATASAYWLLCRTGRERAQAWSALRSEALKTSLGRAFDTADPMLDQLAIDVRRHPTSDAREPLLHALYSIATARAGLAWASVSFPDGTFIGVSRGDDGKIHSQESRLGPEGGIKRTFTRDADGFPREIAREATDYDPRTRAFYRLAIEKKRRSWTAPYPFLPLLNTGITRVEPVYLRPGDPTSLLAVLTVDFDASALATLIDAPLWPSQRTLVVTSDGSLLASQGVALPARESLSRDRALHWSELTDPVVSSLRRAHAEQTATLARIEDVQGEPYHVDGARLASLEGMHIKLLTAVPESELFAHAARQARFGALVTGLMTLLGLAFAVALSANIANLRRRRAQAELAAQHAREEVNALGSYELVSLIGSGAMGEVYRARHRLLARDAALKLIKGESTDDDERHQLFFEEARRLASLHSLHTVAVYDFGIASDGRYFLAMELLSGLDLDALVRRYGRQPPARVAAILAQVCESLAEAHEANLVHQDIKPANIFLCRLAEALDFVKVLDFGLSRVVGPRLPAAGLVEGTPAYMAPEQACGEALGPQVDLYAVGGVGFFLLSGRPPYVHADSEELLLAHVNAPIPALPDEVRATTPPALLQLLTRCLAKRPEHRPVSARVLAQAFREVALESENTFPAEQRERWWTRHMAQTGADSVSTPAAPHARTLDQRLYTGKRRRATG